jgi:2-polyprenyl-3-methyl-5-hydroxy-6-metoxy-1,4-benzoquinol methylase
MIATSTHGLTGERERFEFGENWRRFLDVVGDGRIAAAMDSFRRTVGSEWLAGRSVLDIGCGSGLFSLAAVLAGAGSVRAFDFDRESVRCAQTLRQRYAREADWQIEPGSVLDRQYIESLGKFDLVYAWGVLHHTGDMWNAMEHAAVPVAAGGYLVVSIYNDQGRRSRRWLKVKRIYNSLPRELRTPFVVAVMGPREMRLAAGSAARLRFADYARTWSDYERTRGMSRWHDLVDWCGGYPFEVAKPEQVFDFYAARGIHFAGVGHARRGAWLQRVRPGTGRLG